MSLTCSLLVSLLIAPASAAAPSGPDRWRPLRFTGRRVSSWPVPPRQWCSPTRAFGDPHAPVRVWQPPHGRPHLLDEFRAGVVQHAIAISVRRYKNSQEITQDDLGRLDTRPDATNKWNARLNGRINMTLKDIAVLIRFLPSGLPPEAEIQILLDVVEHKRPPPPGWLEIDT